MIWKALAWIVWCSDVWRWGPMLLRHPIRFWPQAREAARLYGPNGTRTRWLAEQRKKYNTPT